MANLAVPAELVDVLMRVALLSLVITMGANGISRPERSTERTAMLEADAASQFCAVWILGNEAQALAAPANSSASEMDKNLMHASTTTPGIADASSVPE